MVGQALVCPLPTTLRRMLCVVAAGMVLPAAAAEPTGEATSEVDVVRAALQGPVVQHAVEAGQRRARASGTAAPWMPDPILEARQEQANGPAGNSTQIVGGSVVLPPGLPGLATHRAAALREEAGAKSKAA